MKIGLSWLKNRRLIQVLAALAANPHLTNFWQGKIYTGQTKLACLPGLNCYSCPGAAGSCPIGSLQAVIGSRHYNFSFYVVGFLLLWGTVLGRLICGFLCVFGLFQDLLYKIPTPKLQVNSKIDRPLRWLKYLVLAVLVLALPMALTNNFGLAPPYFCKLVCPSGTLLGGIPLVLSNPSLQAMLGFLFTWKIALLLLTILASIFIYRPFCKYICPLGAIYGLFNRFSFYKMTVDADRCVGCQICEKNCKMQVKVTQNINSLECIRCGECKKICPQGAIGSGFKWYQPENQPQPSVLPK